MLDPRNLLDRPRGGPTARFLASAALVLASGAYVFWQQGEQAPRREAGKAIGARMRMPAEKPASSAPTIIDASGSAPATPPGSAPPKAAADIADRLPQTAPQPDSVASARPAPPAVAAATPDAAPPPAPEAPAQASPAAGTIAASLPPRPAFVYADGDYTGEPADCEWGTVQVEILVQSGAVTQVNFLQVPDHRRRSAEISDWAMPVLAREAIREQNYDVDIVSSATSTSLAFQQAFYNALTKAKK